MKPEKHLSELIYMAKRLGASDAGIIFSADIEVNEDLAALCSGDHPCSNYGLSSSCPPHVPGPPRFLQWKNSSKYSIVVRIDVPSVVMFSEERHEVMQLLHEIVAGIELKAVEMGYNDSKAFAGGSCKEIFCREHAACQVISRHGKCRNPLHARPSMSGFGINVAKLMQSAGWPVKKQILEDKSDTESMTWVAGLILLEAGIMKE
jgi:predicted metal-binding protein